MTMIGMIILTFDYYDYLDDDKDRSSGASSATNKLHSDFDPGTHDDEAIKGCHQRRPIPPQLVPTTNIMLLKQK